MACARNIGLFDVFRIGWLKAILLCLLFLVVSYDGCHDWDENTYLARTAYLEVGNLDTWLSLSGRAVWEYDWYRAKVSHLFLLDVLFSVFAPGRTGIFMVSLVFALMMLGVGVAWKGILELVTEDRGKAFYAALLALCSPVALYLSYKALTETTALFFTVLALYLFVRSWETGRLTSACLVAVSALFLLAGVTSRMEVIVLFYAFGAGMLLYRPREYFALICRYLIFSVVFLIFFAIFWGITGINPYAAANNQELSNCVRDYPYNLINAFLAMGGLLPLMILGCIKAGRWPSSRLGLGLYLLPTVALLIVLLTVAMRHQYMGILGAGLLAANGMELIRRNNFPNWSKTLVSAIVFVILVLNLFLVRTLGEVGVEGRDIEDVLSAVLKDPGHTVCLTDGPTNTFAYLRVAYPDFSWFPTSPGIPSDPSPIMDITNLLEISPKTRIVYLFPYRKKRTWLEKLIDRIRGREIIEYKHEKKNWLAAHPSIRLIPLADRGRYALFQVELNRGPVER